MAEQTRWSMGLEPPPSSTDRRTADLGDIVVFVDGQSETTGILEFAGVLAQEHGANLIAVFMQREPAITPPETFARGKGIRDVIDAHQAQLEEIEAHHRALFDNIVRRHEIRPEWRSVSYFSSDVGEHAHYADLAVVARPDPAGLTASPPGLIESLVVTSGRPIIVFPPRGTVSRVRRILVGWNARREAVRAVAERPAITCEGRGDRGFGHRPSASRGPWPGAGGRHCAPLGESRGAS